VDQLDRYCGLVWDWNERLNLTRHTDYDKFVSRDLLDTVQIAKFLEPDEEVLDVGTGGGVPGVVLAIIRPDLQVSLCESVRKKAQAVDSMIETLELPVPVYADRAEKVLEDLRFDTLIARAVGPLWKMCTWFKHHWHQFDRLLAIKGPSWPEERGEARHRGLMHGVGLRKIASYPMPGTESESVILSLRGEATNQN
jgi:16S rRNA (guanine527-N7)-methyltransferase